MTRMSLVTAPPERVAAVSAALPARHAAPMPARTVVVDHPRRPEETAAIAIDPAANRVRVISTVAERYPEINYVDRRPEVLSLAIIENEQEVATSRRIEPSGNSRVDQMRSSRSDPRPTW